MGEVYKFKLTTIPLPKHPFNFHSYIIYFILPIYMWWVQYNKCPPNNQIKNTVIYQSLYSNNVLKFVDHKVIWYC